MMQPAGKYQISKYNGHPKTGAHSLRADSNAMYRNSEAVHVFCNSLFFQQPPADVCTSNRSHIIAGCVKTVVRTSPRKKGKKNEWKHKFIHSHNPHFPRPYIWHFLSRNTVRLQLNMLPFFPPIFFVVVSNSFGMHPRII